MRAAPGRAARSRWGCAGGRTRRSPCLDAPARVFIANIASPGIARGAAGAASGPVPPRLGAQRSLGSSTGRSFARSSGATGPASHPSRLQIRASLGGRAGPVGRPGVRAAVSPTLSFPPTTTSRLDSLLRTLLPRGCTGVGVCGLRAGAPSSRRSALPRIVHRTILRSLFRRDGTRFAPITPSDSRLARGQGRPGRPPRGLSRRAPTLSFPPTTTSALDSLLRTLLPRGRTGVGVCGLRAGAPSSRRSALPRIVHRTILRSLFRRDGTRFAPITPSDSRLARGQGRPGRPPRGPSRRAPTLSFPPTTTPHWIPYCEHCFPGDARGSACAASGPVPPRLGAQRSLGSSTGRSFARSSGATGPASHPSRLQIRASLGGRAGPVGRPGSEPPCAHPLVPPDHHIALDSLLRTLLPRGRTGVGGVAPAGPRP